MKSKLIFGLLMLLVFFVGCTSQNISGIVKSLPEVKSFLDEHPDAKIDIVLLEGDYIQSHNMVSSLCSSAINADYEYYYANITEGSTQINVWLDKDFKVLCMKKESDQATGTDIQEKLSDVYSEKDEQVISDDEDKCPGTIGECTSGVFIKTSTYKGGNLDGCAYYDCCGDGVCFNTEDESNLCPEDCNIEEEKKCPGYLDGTCNHEIIRTSYYSGGNLDGCPYYDCCGDKTCTGTEKVSGLCEEDCGETIECSDTWKEDVERTCDYEIIQTTTVKGGQQDGCPYYDCCGDDVCTNTEQNSELCDEDCTTYSVSGTKCAHSYIGTCDGEIIQRGVYDTGGGSLDGCPRYLCCKDGNCQ